MAVTTSDWPGRASPQANTPWHLGSVDRRLHVAARVEVEAQLGHRALVLGVAEADRDQHQLARGSTNSLPGTGFRSREEVPSTRQPRTADTLPSSPSSSITSVPKRRSPPSSSA